MRWVAPIDHLVFIGTDQQSEKFRPRDTYAFAQLLAAVIPDRFPGKIGAAQVATIGQDVDPSLYDEALDGMGTILSGYAAQQTATCIVLPIGGIPACNTALIFAGGAPLWANAATSSISQKAARQFRWKWGPKCSVCCKKTAFWKRWLVLNLPRP
ncbi:MAG: hypothetical protein HC804_11960 [Anaerolineae bacterium]|nr:hypothetical protein [Anaerolineae bacterium]